MIYGYARISTNKQNIERQVRNIQSQYPNALILKETYTGTKIERKQLDKILKTVKKGDTIVFDSVSRMSRNAEEGFALYEELLNNGIELVFIKEPHINTQTYKESQNRSIDMTGNEIADIYIEATNRVLMVLAKRQIELAFEQAQKEVDDLHQRTKEGIETARINGKQIGLKKGTKLVTKKSVKAKELIIKHNKTFGGTLDNEETIQLLGISKATFYKYKNELKQERNM